MRLEDYIVPIIVSNVISLVLIFICWKWPKIGKAIWGIIFIAAGLFNGYHAFVSPDVYAAMYGPGAVFSFYRDFISGIFSEQAALFVSVIALGQILVGLFFLMRKIWFRLGILGGIVFLSAITPLGFGSAFPATILMIISLLVLWRQYRLKE